MLASQFQSTLPREERRMEDTANKKPSKDFNPRSHERSDRNGSRCSPGLLNFNPRSHERSDGNQKHKWKRHPISIHAPTRGATASACREKILLKKFQSTLPREERRQLQIHASTIQNFNPRSHERSDSNIAQKICLFLYNTDNKYIIR